MKMATSICMARPILTYQEWYRIKGLNASSFIIVVFIGILLIETAISQSTVADCRLSVQASPFGNISGCEGGNWGDFLPKDCCGIALDEYLYILGKRANRTGLIYFNETEQRDCLDLLRNSDEDVLTCGFGRFTSGGGSCYDYTVNDVTNMFTDEMKNLRDDCNFSSNDDDFNYTCSNCLKSWSDIDVSSARGFDQVDTVVCRVAILVAIMSNRIDDLKWIKAVDRCLGEEHLNGDSSVGNEAKKEGKRKAVTAVLLGALIGIALLACFFTWKLLKKRAKSTNSLGKEASKELLEEVSGCRKIPIKEIYAATNDLNVSNFIGQGIAGKVYKGVLSNGKRVAIKHIIKDGYVETFVREVTSLSHVTHPNLVSLIGYCEEEDECFLVYELCSSGNLSEWLFGKDKMLSWIQRLEIAIDSAHGLHYLHTYPEGCIVHRDIKPTNILVGDNFEAKLSDFGLSKVMDLGQSYVSSEVRGTFGYVDPEYRRNHRVNPAGDVYSFGIVLLQLLSGKRVINLNVTRPMPLDKMAKLLLKGGNVKEFADPKLNGEFSVEAFHLALKLALSCTAHKQQRPNMEQVVTRLEEALDISTGVDTMHRDLSF